MLNSEGHCKLIDFGFAKIIDNARATTCCGTVAYAAPEVIAGLSHYSFSADLWSFGILLYELCTG